MNLCLSETKDACGTSFVHRGRAIRRQDVEHIQAVAKSCSGLSRSELAETICEHWGWVTATGSHKIQACVTLLERLEAEGSIELTAKRVQPRAKPKAPRWTSRTAPHAVLSEELSALGTVQLEVAVNRDDKDLWNEYVSRYHYLGYQKPFGCRLRYFVVSERGLLGCVLLAGAAKAISVRDDWIGWTNRERLNNLPWVVNNTRLLLFPWVQVKCLASHVLGKLVRRVRQDWKEHFGYRPVLLETFVDPARHRGICYQAAGWNQLGQTSGRGLARVGRRYRSTPKLIYVRPLVEEFRGHLCSAKLIGAGTE